MYVSFVAEMLKEKRLVFQRENTFSNPRLQINIFVLFCAIFYSRCVFLHTFQLKHAVNFHTLRMFDVVRNVCVFKMSMFVIATTVKLTHGVSARLCVYVLWNQWHIASVSPCHQNRNFLWASDKISLTHRHCVVRHFIAGTISYFISLIGCFHSNYLDPFSTSLTSFVSAWNVSAISNKNCFSFKRSLDSITSKMLFRSFLFDVFFFFCFFLPIVSFSGRIAVIKPCWVGCVSI